MPQSSTTTQTPASPSAEIAARAQDSGRHLRVIYDGDCPLCRSFCRVLRLREITDSLEIVDARVTPEALAEVSTAGFNLDEGMVVIVNSRMYHGANAMHVLALLSSRSGLFNQLLFRVFKSGNRANALYPVLRAGRNLLLKLLGKQKLNQRDAH